jgi:hypothetical protein
VGTSTSQRSPRTTPWQAVALTYRDDAFPVEQVAQQLWRAAQSDPDADWGQLLASPIVPACLDIALASNSSSAALRQATFEIVRSRQASIAADIAKRAVVRSFAEPGDRAAAFAAALFGEASNYLVSRDLSGFIGADARNRTVGEAAAFRDAVRSRVEAVVRSTPLPADASRTNRWGAFVDAVVGRLRGAT